MKSTKKEDILLQCHETSEDWIANQNILPIVAKRFNQITDRLSGKYFYRISVSKTPTRINYHYFHFEFLNEISRTLTNGMSTLGLLTNRNFWGRYFLGGVRTISINQRDNNDYPTFTLNYLVYSDFDNLDVKIWTSLNSRIRRIDPTLELKFTFLGSFTDQLVEDNICFYTQVDYENPNLKKLGEKTFDNIFNNQFQRPRFLGELFSLKQNMKSL